MGFWRLTNILSLDVVAGSVLGCAFFAHLFGVVLYVHAFISLGLIVWIIYTTDHLLDGIRSESEPSTSRHRFHRTYRKSLTIAVIVAVVLVAFEAFYIRKPVLFAGVAVATLVIGYLLLQASLKFAKELSGAFLYTLGITAGPWSLLERRLMEPEIILVLLYGMTALINLLLFSLIDRETDLKDKHVSFATVFGNRSTLRTITACFSFNSAMCIYLLLAFPDYAMAVAVILAMNILLYCTSQFRTRLVSNDMYRRVGDLAFLIPGIYVLYDTIN